MARSDNFNHYNHVTTYTRISKHSTVALVDSCKIIRINKRYITIHVRVTQLISGFQKVIVYITIMTLTIFCSTTNPNLYEEAVEVDVIRNSGNAVSVKRVIKTKKKSNCTFSFQSNNGTKMTKIELIEIKKTTPKLREIL